MGAIRQAAERGQTLTRQLLAFSRRQTLNPVVVELKALVRDFAPLLQQAVGEAVALDLVLPATEVCAHVDPTHLETALLNLSVNARDAMAREGRLTISVATESSPDEGAGRVLVTVSDTGEGMSAEVAKRIFEPFYTTKDVGKGSGLGLSQVYGFVTQSGGDVRVETQPGQGAAFVLSLPFCSQVPAERLAVEPEGLVSASERLLIVEDDPEVRALCVDLLEGLGYRCDTATTAAEALHQLQSGELYDLMFSDVVMPGGMTGIDLARRATEAFPAMRVLLTSGYVGENALQDPHDFEVIDKPYEEAGLARRLRLLLDGERREDLRRVHKRASARPRSWPLTTLVQRLPGAKAFDAACAAFEGGHGLGGLLDLPRLAARRHQGLVEGHQELLNEYEAAHECPG